MTNVIVTEVQALKKTNCAFNLCTQYKTVCLQYITPLPPLHIINIFTQIAKLNLFRDRGLREKAEDTSEAIAAMVTKPAVSQKHTVDSFTPQEKRDD